MIKRMLSCILAVLIMSLAVSGCGIKKNGSADKGTTKDKVKETVSVQSLKPVTLTFCFPGYGDTGLPYNKDNIDQMLAELNKKTEAELKATIRLEWVPYETYNEELTKRIAASGGPDVFARNSLNLKDLADKKLIANVDALLRQYAPKYMGMLQENYPDRMNELKIDGMLYAIPNNSAVSNRYCVLAKQDLVMKYLNGDIGTLEDYDKFLKAVKGAEKGMLSGYIGAYDFFNAYMTGNGYFSSLGPSYYNRWDGNDLTPIPIERTNAFDAAYRMIREWREQNLFFGSRDYTATLNEARQKGKLASVFLPMNSYRQNGIQYLTQGFKIYPLYMDRPFLKTYFSHPLLISGITGNSARVVMFIEWLQSEQAHYDLFMYGNKDLQYDLDGNVLKFTEDMHVIYGWWGSNSFTNYVYERPFSFEPVEYKKFQEDTAYKNTFDIREIYGKRGYNVSEESYSDELMEKLEREMEGIQGPAKKRNEAYQQFLADMDVGRFQKPFDEVVRALDDAGNDQIVKVYRNMLDEVKISK